MTYANDPNELTPDQQMDAIGKILAIGFQRLRTRIFLDPEIKSNDSASSVNQPKIKIEQTGKLNETER